MLQNVFFPLLFISEHSLQGIQRNINNKLTEQKKSTLKAARMFQLRVLSSKSSVNYVVAIKAVFKQYLPYKKVYISK